MSTLQIAVVTMIWIFYGIFSAFQCHKEKENLIDLFMYCTIFSVFAPAILLYRMLVGMIHPFSVRDSTEEYQK